MASLSNQIQFTFLAILHLLRDTWSVLLLLGLCLTALALLAFPIGSVNLDVPVPPLQVVDDKVVTYDPGVHVFPAKNFPQRLAEFRDNNRQTIIVSVCRSDDGYIVVTSPDPEWLKILPGSQRPPIGQPPGQPLGQRPGQPID